MVKTERKKGDGRPLKKAWPSSYPKQRRRHGRQRLFRGIGLYSHTLVTHSKHLITKTSNNDHQGTLRYVNTLNFFLRFTKKKHLFSFFLSV